MKHWVRANKGFLMFVVLLGVLRTAVADWNPIPSGSMRPNLLEGDVVFVNRLAFDLKVPLTDVIVAHLSEPRRGDVVTFTSPADGAHLIKRIMAVPGDVVEMRGDRLTINGVAADYAPIDAVNEEARGALRTTLRMNETVGTQRHRVQVMPALAARRDFAAMTIPPQRYLMLGDNRDNSADSRFIGLVPRALLIGRAVRVLVSADILGNWMPRTERFGMSLN